MKKEKLLKEAKKRYPVGTKIKCAYDGEVSIVGHELRVDSDGDVYHTSKLQFQYVMYDGKWAEIIEPKSEIERLEEKYYKVEEKQKKRAESIAKMREKYDYNKLLDEIIDFSGEIRKQRILHKLSSTTMYTISELKELRSLISVNDREFEYVVNSLNHCGVSFESAYKLISFGLVG